MSNLTAKRQLYENLALWTIRRSMDRNISGRLFCRVGRDCETD